MVGRGQKRPDGGCWCDTAPCIKPGIFLQYEVYWIKNVNKIIIAGRPDAIIDLCVGESILKGNVLCLN